MTRPARATTAHIVDGTAHERVTVHARVTSVTRTETERHHEAAAIVRLSYRNPVTGRYTRDEVNMIRNLGILYDLGVQIHDLPLGKTVKPNGEVYLQLHPKAIIGWVNPNPAPPIPPINNYDRDLQRVRDMLLRIQQVYKVTPATLWADVMGVALPRGEA